MIRTFLYWLSVGATWKAMAAAAIPAPVVYPLKLFSYGDLCRDFTDSSAMVSMCLLSSSTTCSCRRGMHLIQRKGCPECMVYFVPFTSQSYTSASDIGMSQHKTMQILLSSWVESSVSTDTQGSSGAMVLSTHCLPATTTTRSIISEEFF